jgi:hypothetical protein
MRPLPTRSGGKETSDAAQSLTMALDHTIVLIAQISTRAPVSLSRINKLTFRNAAAYERPPAEAPASPQLPINKHLFHVMPQDVYAQLDQLITQVRHRRNGVLDASAAATMRLTEFYLAAETVPQDTGDFVWAKDLQTEIAVLEGKVKEENEVLKAMEEMRTELLKRWKAVTEKGCVPEPDVWVQDLNEGALKEPNGME